MAREIVDIGVEGNDGTGDAIREAFRKTNENFQELYAVFGIGGQINFTNLGDTPSSYTGLASRLMGVKTTEDGVEALELASNGALTGDATDDTITYNYTVAGKLIITAGNSKLSSDLSPKLSGPLNGNNFGIGNVAVTDNAATAFTNKYGGTHTIDDLVIDKQYADQRYTKGGTPNKQGGARPEPANATQYTLTIANYNSSSNPVITGHGYDRAANGVAVTYNATTTAATNLTKLATYFIAIVDKDTMSLHPTSADAIAGTNRILATGGAGTQTILDQTYLSTLAGFYTSEEVLPRNAVTRRQGDTMTGPLYLSDHPGDLAGQAATVENLQAATKYYVDQSSHQSTTNFFVSTKGDDRQTDTPAGKEGRSLSFAFKTIGAACRKAEELMIASPQELGPYKQTITFGSTATISTTQSVGIQTIVSGRLPVKTLIDANINFIKAEVVAFINATYPDLTYDSDICARDIGLIVNSIVLDTLTGNNANYLSKTAGIRYYSNSSGKLAVTTQKTETLAGIAKAKSLVSDILQNNTVTALQTVYSQTKDAGQVVNATGLNSVNAKFVIVVGIINDGVFTAPATVDGSVYLLNIANGGNGHVDQGNPTNTDILPGKSVRGKTSGAIGKIIAFNYESDALTTTPANQDQLQLQLLEPLEFIAGEALEYANTVNRAEATIFVESGRYFEDFPIKVPANTSIKGDEFRRCIIAPNDRSSQSPWANTYFYRDLEFDNLTGNATSVTGYGDTNIPTSGGGYVDPLTGNVVGYFGKHYLTNNAIDINVGNSALTNPGSFPKAGKLLTKNKLFIIEEVIQFIDDTYPSLSYSATKCRRDTGFIIDGIIKDLNTGGRAESLKNQGAYYVGSVAGQVTETSAAINYIKTITPSILANTAFGAKLGAVAQIIDTSITSEASVQTNLDALVDVIRFAFNASYNPPKNNKLLDVFMCGDATRISNVSVQGHGGFMMVLDPNGQVLTKSPYAQVGSSFSQSINRQAFRGGMLVDAYTGNVPMKVTNKDSIYQVDVASDAGTGLYIKKPQVPAPFYIDGQRFQVNAVRDWDPALGTATLILDRSSNSTAGWTGTLADSFNLDTVSAASPIEITVQTAGNRSMLGNDFTQVNDLGYGLIVTNGGLSEMVSQFTYYCHTAYYANKGGEIRSLNGSNAYGNFGLVANGSDPNEIPDSVTLRDNMVMPGKTAEANITLTFADVLTLSTRGNVVTQAVTGATGTVVFTTKGKVLYLKDTSGTFNTTNDITLSAGSANLGAPALVVTGGYTLASGQLNIYVYDMEHKPQNKGEVDILHASGTLVRHEVSNVSKVTDFIVDGHQDVAYTLNQAGGSGAKFDITKSTQGGYGASVRAAGTGYSVNNTITVLGAKLDGATAANNATITVATINASGAILTVTVAGTIAATTHTPKHDGQVYKFAFTTSNSGFDNAGLIENTDEDTLVGYRQNQAFVLNGVANPATLTTRPSTAIQFDEQPTETYRTVAFTITESTGEDLPNNTVLTNFDATFDYVRIIVDKTNAAAATYSGAGGATQGATAGDDIIAIEEVTALSDRQRIDRGDMVFAWSGKLHTVSNYIDRGAYSTVQIAEVANSDLNKASNQTGIHSTMVLGGSKTNTLRCGLPAGAPGDVTISISTCRATGHDFLDIGTGSFNTSNYPNVLLGDPQPAVQANEVDERDKGRCFFVSTDQDGFFRVGKFFTVDQGTGTVTFAGSIALSNLDGIGFKRGVVVAEFSTDNGMTANGSDIVPTQSAVRNYVNRRLGWDHNGLTANNIIGSGAMALDGTTAMTGNMNMGSNQVTNLQAPSADSHAATKAYVDGVVDNFDSLEELRNTEFNSPAANQLIVFTGKKRLIIDADTIGGTGTWAAAQTFAQASSSATGTVVDVETTTDPILGNIQIITYTATANVVAKGGDKVIVTSGPTADILDGPFDEIANAIADGASAMSVTVTRAAGSTTALYSFAAGSIDNAAVSATAAIVQSKLNMNAASTRVNATGIAQSDLGLASFDSGDFTITNGWVTLKAGGVDLADLPSMADLRVLGNISGSAATPTEVPITTISANSSLVMTKDDGKVRVAKLVVGADDGYVILQPKSGAATTIQMLTPGGGVILEGVGTNATMTTEFPGSIDIGNSGGNTQSSLQANSNFAAESRLSSDWVYTNFIEAANEKGTGTTGIALGADTGKSVAGEITILTKDGATTKAPFKFSATGVVPDATNTYNIGSSSLVYNTVYATTFSGTATSAKYADLAENYLGDVAYEPGTVLMFGGANEVTETTSKGTTKIAGVVSTNPAHLMNAELAGEFVSAVALQGRVPCKVIGMVEAGDMLVASSVPGYAMVDNSPGVGAVLGKAVGTKQSADKGTVEIVVGRV